jgi:cyclic pyranopterin phosphate synthase
MLAHALRAASRAAAPARARAATSRPGHDPPAPDADVAPADLAAEAAALNDELASFFGAPQEPGAEAASSPPENAAAPSPGAFAAAAPPRLTHVDARGRAAMIDVSAKPATARSATAAARVLLGAAAYALVAENRIAKGDVLTVAQLAGVMAAKQTAALIPLCHPLALAHVDVRLRLAPAAAAVDIEATAATVGPTGVEMEAMTAAAVAALTVYDMCKATSKGIEIGAVRLLRKSGGRSGAWERGGAGGAGGDGGAP